MDVKIVLNGETYVSEAKIVSSLAAVYDGRGMMTVALLCDDHLDRSGRLLGLVRDEAIRLSKEARRTTEAGNRPTPESDSGPGSRGGGTHP